MNGRENSEMMWKLFKKKQMQILKSKNRIYF